MIRFDIKLDRLLSPWVRQVKEGLTPVLEAATKDTTAYGKGLIIRSTAKGPTGLTQGGWNSDRVGIARWKIWNRFKHALFLETGTGLYGPLHHLIYPKVAKFLAWQGWVKNTTSGWIFARFTRGMPAQPAIKPNVDKIQKDLNIRVRNGIRKLYKAVHA